MVVWFLVITLIFGDGRIQNKIITPPNVINNNADSCDSAARAISNQILENFQKLDPNVKVFSSCIPMNKDIIDNAGSEKS